MNRVPSELLHYIFIQVPLEQRLKCTLVCRSWYNVLSKRSLLYDIFIWNDKRYNNFIDILQHFPDRASQVEILDLRINTKIDTRIFCILLPNLRNFQYWEYSSWSRHEYHNDQLFKLLNPDSKLEVIKDCGDCEFTKTLLMFCSCTRLRCLELDLQSIDNSRKEVFKYLKSAPALKKLVLDSCQIGIDDCEQIHNSLSVLETLELRGMTLIACELPRDITPATTLTKLIVVIYEMRYYPDYLDWYTYMAKKYSSLSSFQCFNRKLSDGDPSKTIQLYRDGIFPIYINNGNRLKSFSAVNVPTELDLFHWMDQYHLRVTEFYMVNNKSRPIFEQLAVSNQAKYAESIELQNTDMTSPFMIQNFISLTSLNIFNYSRPINNITGFLNGLPPTLTSLMVHTSDATMMDALPTLQNNVKELFFESNIITPELGEAISNCFPKLTYLSLHGCVAENVSINLRQNHFKLLEFKTDYRQEFAYAFSITNAECPQPRYLIKRYYKRKNKPVTRNDLEGRIIVSLHYASAKLLHCNDVYFGTG